jgi:hypothetical protein
MVKSIKKTRTRIKLGSRIKRKKNRTKVSKKFSSSKKRPVSKSFMRRNRFGMDSDCSRECDEVEKQLFQVKLQLDNLLEQELTLIRNVSSRPSGNSAADELLNNRNVYNMMQSSNIDKKHTLQDFLIKTIHNDFTPIQGGGGDGAKGKPSGEGGDQTSKGDCGAIVRKHGVVEGRSIYDQQNKGGARYIYASKGNTSGWYTIDTVKSKSGALVVTSANPLPLSSFTPVENKKCKKPNQAASPGSSSSSPSSSTSSNLSTLIKVDVNAGEKFPDTRKGPVYLESKDANRPGKYLVVNDNWNAKTYQLDYNSPEPP